jgi:glutamate 5-kinase
VSKIVIKIGSNILTDRKGGLNQRRIRLIAKEVSSICSSGNDIIIVSSGAVAAGLKKLGLKEKPKEIRLKQAVASIGQSSLMWSYEKEFRKFGKKVAQILLTREDFSDRIRYLNAKNTISTLLSYGVIPVINENDTVATEEIRFGDNDQLAALVAALIEAERLIILSDVDGLYPADPKKNPEVKIIPIIKEITPEVEAMAGGEGSAIGTGGMYSKVLAAKKATSFGIRVNIISGKKSGLITSLLKGKQKGTEFLPNPKKISSKKGWIAYAVKPKGELKIDDGAVKAILKLGKSLLPSGISEVVGRFDIGDAVYILDKEGNKIAKGLVNYSSEDIEKIKGKKTSEISSILGYKYSDEVIHRDNLALSG